MRQRFVTQLIQFLKHCKNQAHPVDQCRVQELPILVHLIDLLSILLRCNGFLGIQKPVVDQTGSRPPNSNQDLFFFLGASLALGSALELILSPTTEMSITSCY
ncbi:hypothetical protein FD754_023427, partial [Muntiacus muntjak]